MVITCWKAVAIGNLKWIAYQIITTESTCKNFSTSKQNAKEFRNQQDAKKQNFDSKQNIKGCVCENEFKIQNPGPKELQVKSNGWWGRVIETKTQ